MRRFGVILILLVSLVLSACAGSTALPPPTATTLALTATAAPLPSTRPTTAASVTSTAVTSALPTTLAATVRPVTPAPIIPTTKIGDIISNGAYKVTVNAVERAKQYGIAKVSSGRVFVALDLTFESGKDTGVSVNPANANIIDTSAARYDVTVAGKFPSLPTQNDLPSGERTRGWWTFEVPESAKNLVFEYKGGVPEVLIRFDLEQNSPQPAKLAPTQLPKIAKIGETITDQNYLITVNTVEKVKEYGSTKAKSGMVFVAIEITIASGKDGGVNVNPLYVYVRDSDFFSYPGFAVGKEPFLRSDNDIAKGSNIRGWVTVEVPETAKGLIFEYRAGNPETRVRVNLGL